VRIKERRVKCRRGLCLPIMLRRLRGESTQTCDRPTVIVCSYVIVATEDSMAGICRYCLLRQSSDHSMTANCENPCGKYAQSSLPNLNIDDRIRPLGSLSKDECI
jgi:hypothetical protein